MRTQKRAPLTSNNPVHEAIMANPLVRSWPLPAEAPLTGFVHYALAFSTLLSSQGADAHRHKAFAWIGGNPHSLPARYTAVKWSSPDVDSVSTSCTSSQPAPRTDPSAGRTAR